MFAKSLLLGAFVALAAAQSAVLTFTRVPNPITAGQENAILYATNDIATPVTIILRRGAATNLQVVKTLTTSATQGQYIWTPATSLANGNDYALEIRQAGEFNYFGPFTLQGGSASSMMSMSMSMSMTSTVTGSMTTMAPSMNTTMPIYNTTMIMTGTGCSLYPSCIPRNETMVAPTLSNTAAPTDMETMPTATDGGSSPTDDSMVPPQSTNAASTEFGGKSTVALVFGAMAAAFFAC